MSSASRAAIAAKSSCGAGSSDTPSCGTHAVPTTSSAIILSPYWVEFVLLNGNRPKHRGGSPCLRRSTYESLDRKSTRLNSSHGYISYAVFCLKKKKPIESFALATSTLSYHSFWLSDPSLTLYHKLPSALAWLSTSICTRDDVILTYLRPDQP